MRRDNAIVSRCSPRSLYNSKSMSFSPGAPLTLAAQKHATTTIPIVMTNDGDPVGNGFVASLARPGGNITGLSTLTPELAGKRLDLLKEIVPKLSRLAVFGTSNSASNAQELKEVEGAAGVLGVKLQYFDVLALNDIEPAFRAAAKGRADAVLWLVSGWHLNCGPRPGCGAEFKKPVADDLLQLKSCGSRRADVLRG